MKQKKLFVLVSCIIISLTLFGLNFRFVGPSNTEIHFLKTSDDYLEGSNDTNSGATLLTPLRVCSKITSL